MMEAISFILFGPLVELIPEKYIHKMSADLRSINSRTPVRVWLARSFLILFSFSITSLFSFIFSPLSFFAIIGIVFSLLHTFYPSWKSSALVDDLIDRIPSALLSASSSLQTGQTPEEVIEFLSKKAKPPLDSLFQKTLSLSTRQRTEPGRSLQQLLKSYNSPELDRASSLLAAGIQSGANLQSLFSTVARDLLTVRELRKHQIQQMKSLKYILILSGILLIPLILSMSVQISYLLDYSPYNLSLASQISFIPFSIALAFTISYFCDFEPKKAFFYFPIFLLLQFSAFNSIFLLYPKV